MDNITLLNTNLVKVYIFEPKNLNGLLKKITQVRRPPADIVRRHRLDTNFYTKYTQAYGVPILANYVVDDRLFL